MANIILLGKPGSGKGTIASILVEKHGYYHLSGSDVLRENSQDESAKYYKEARHALETGILVAYDIINGMVEEKLKSLKGQNIVFDGFPRSIEQTEALIGFLGDQPVKAVYLDIDDAVITERIVNRLTCKSCAASFNKIGMLPKVEGVCDHCGGELHTRVDDNEETLKTRLDQYTTHTQPVMDMLKKHMTFETINHKSELKI